jgi:hypothetical protein
MNYFGFIRPLQRLYLINLPFHKHAADMTAEQKTFWMKIKNFEMDDPRSTFSFSDRLSRENGWTFEFSLHVIDEYKKFMFLLCYAPHPLTPSDAVDQVWHLHLLYTESYWIDFCDHVLNRKVHHGPTRGGTFEKNKFEHWYKKTLELYLAIFSQPPPPTIWPDSKTRFSDIHFQRVNTNKNWIIPKPSFLNV